MIVNNEREKTIYQQGFMSGVNAAKADRGQEAVKGFASCLQEAFYADWQHGDISEETYKFIIGEILFVLDEEGYGA